MASPTDPGALPAWRDELDAIVGARAHGQFEEIVPRLQRLDARYPNTAEISYQLAWTQDTLGRAAEAVPLYEKAIALGLPPNELSGALLGLGSTLRALGRLEQSAATLRSGQAQFPENREFAVFLALTLHAQGDHAAALRLVLETLCDTTDDPGLTAYQRALRHEAGKLEPTLPAPSPRPRGPIP
ncbi:MAG TPA: tetratricopeptide repeat protein [Opitutaceae bacterium]|nr:tetratricopeptide repeat protein [Opitutaceae bacterium]